MRIAILSLALAAAAVHASAQQGALSAAAISLEPSSGQQSASAGPEPSGSDPLGAIRRALKPVSAPARMRPEWLTPQAVEALTVMALRTRCEDRRVTAQTLERAAAIVHAQIIPELARTDGTSRAMAFLQSRRLQGLRRTIDKEVELLRADCEELEAFPSSDIQKVSKAGAAVLANASALAEASNPYSQAVAFSGKPEEMPRKVRIALQELRDAAETLLKRDAQEQAGQAREQAIRAQQLREAANRPALKVFKDTPVAPATEQAPTSTAAPSPLPLPPLPPPVR